MNSEWVKLNVLGALGQTYRMEVPGGWIYLRITSKGEAMTFVPDPEWHSKQRKETEVVKSET